MLKNQIKTIDEYIDAFPKDVQVKLQKIRQTIKAAAPQALEGISYKMPAFKIKKYLVFFAAFKNHIGFYPMPSAIQAFKKELSMYKTAKGSIQFPMDKPIPFDLIKRIVKFRMKEITEKK